MVILKQQVDIVPYLRK